MFLHYYFSSVPVMICWMLCTSSGIWCMFSLEASPLRSGPDVLIFSLFLPLPHSTNSKDSSSDPLPHILLSLFSPFSTSIFTSCCLPLPLLYSSYTSTSTEHPFLLFFYLFIFLIFFSHPLFLPLPQYHWLFAWKLADKREWRLWLSSWKHFRFLT